MCGVYVLRRYIFLYMTISKRYSQRSPVSPHGLLPFFFPEFSSGAVRQVLFGTDSHTCNAGAFGQFATGIGNTDASFVLGTGKLLIKSPASMRFALEGEMPDHLLAKVWQSPCFLLSQGHRAVDNLPPTSWLRTSCVAL